LDEYGGYMVTMLICNYFFVYYWLFLYETTKCCYHWKFW